MSRSVVGAAVAFVCFLGILCTLFASGIVPAPLIQRDGKHVRVASALDVSSASDYLLGVGKGDITG